MKSSQLTGAEFHKIIKTDFKINEGKWIIKRGLKKNSEVQITGISLSHSLTNANVGFSLSKKANVLFILNDIIDELLDPDLYEVIYKNNIYIYQIGTDWLFKSILGNKILTRIFNASKAGYWMEGSEDNHCLLSFGELTSISSAISRFPNSIVWYKSKNEIFLSKIIENLLIINGTPKLSIILLLKPTIVIVNTLDPSVIDLCLKERIMLFWIHSSDLLNEVLREFNYILSSKLYPTKIYISNSKPKVPLIVNGLNGI